MKSWCIPKASTRFVAKMEDVLEVYARPYDPARPVVCLDEKSKELHGEMREPVPTKPGRERRVDSEYVRHGVANLFLWLEPLMGKRGVQVTQRRCASDFAHQLAHLSDVAYAQAEKIVLVVDNLNTHGPHSLYEAFAPAQARRLAQRFEWHYTPEHGSWLNIAECELSVLERQCVGRRIADRQVLAQEVAAWEQARNGAATTVRWQFTAEDARIKLRRLYPEIHYSSG
ncbi:MAG: IS630 family transposase [bacterium]|nr:IS630 family transposase [bacterium]